MTRRLPLWASLRDALAFAPRAWVQAPLALLLFTAALALPFYGAALGLGPAAKAIAAPLLLLTGVMAEGALYRIGVSKDAKAAKALGLGPLGLQFGKAELHLIGAAVMVSLFLGVVLLALGLVLVFAVNALHIGFNRQEWISAPQGWRVLTFAGLLAAAGWVLAQLSIRLSLYKPATVARGKMVSVSALGLSEHNFWRLLLGLIVVLLPTIGLAAWRTHTQGAGMWTGAIAAGVTGLIQVPLAAGFLSEAYKRLEYWRNHPGEG